MKEPFPKNNQHCIYSRMSAVLQRKKIIWACQAALQHLFFGMLKAHLAFPNE